MKKVAIAFFTILMLLAVCFTMGCSSLHFPGPSPTETQKKVDVGITVNTLPAVVQKYGFDTVTGYLAETMSGDAESAGGNFTPGYHLQYILGTGLDETGNASSWTFAVRHMNETSLVTYDNHGQTVTEWPPSFGSDDINLSEVVSPGDIINLNREAIFPGSQANSTQIEDAILEGGNYTFRISDNGVLRILTFDAKTGVLTP